MRRRRFECGHIGKGQFCHRCRQEELLRASEEAQRQAHTDAIEQLERTLMNEQVELRGFPRGIILKAWAIVQALLNGTRYEQLRGKRLIKHRGVISVPVGNRYRLICKEVDNSIIPYDLMSHERYNNVYG